MPDIVDPLSASLIGLLLRVNAILGQPLLENRVAKA